MPRVRVRVRVRDGLLPPNPNPNPDPQPCLPTRCNAPSPSPSPNPDANQVQCSEADKRAIFMMVDSGGRGTVDAAQLRAALRSSGAITRMYSESLRTLTLTLTLTLALYPLPGTARACAPSVCCSRRPWPSTWASTRCGVTPTLTQQPQP